MENHNNNLIAAIEVLGAKLRDMDTTIYLKDIDIKNLKSKVEELETKLKKAEKEAKW